MNVGNLSRPERSPRAAQTGTTATYVTALISTTQRDSTFAVTDPGDQKRASPTAPADLTATVAGAEKLTIRVQCGDPNGTVTLSDAVLS
jgi:hypothetical protein